MSQSLLPPRGSVPGSVPRKKRLFCLRGRVFRSGVLEEKTDWVGAWGFEKGFYPAYGKRGTALGLVRPSSANSTSNAARDLCPKNAWRRSDGDQSVDDLQIFRGQQALGRSSGSLLSCHRHALWRRYNVYEVDSIVYANCNIDAMSAHVHSFGFANYMFALLIMNVVLNLLVITNRSHFGSRSPHPRGPRVFPNKITRHLFFPTFARGVFFVGEFIFPHVRARPNAIASRCLMLILVKRLLIWKQAMTNVEVDLLKRS